jgi:hypothetical protein
MFKQRAIRYLLLAVTVAFTAVYTAEVAGEETTEVDKVTIGVLAQKPAKFVGKRLHVEGVVARVITNEKVFLMAEKSGCGGCPAKKSCGVSELAVYYDGKMPGKNKKVKVTGVMTEPEKGQYLLKASKLE